jgi:phosphoribosylformimino-5-aminoimidazole carboxamide ribonucleotide (ProFAR) isomerase
MSVNKPIVVPCIDIQGGQVVQLVQGRERALVGPDPLEML